MPGRPRSRDRQTRHLSQRDRERALAELLAVTIRSFAGAINLHGGCMSCGADLAIAREKAKRLGVSA